MSVDPLRLTYTVPRATMLRVLRSSGARSGGIDWGIVAIGAILIIAYLLVAGYLGLSMSAFVVFAAGMASGMTLVWLKVARRQRKEIRATLDAHERAGPVTLTLGADGMRIETVPSLVSHRWAAIDRIAALDGATVLSTGGTLHPVPDAALPADLTPDAFRARLQSWKDAA